MKFEEFKETKEFKLWETLSNHVEENFLRQTDIVSKKDITEFWEPFLELLYKLGNIFKQTGKLKELKVKWMRPIFYIGVESKVKVDDIIYEPFREALDAGQEVKRRLGLFSEIIERFPKVDQTNYKQLKKDFQKFSGDLWKSIIKYVTKTGFKELNQNLKDILAPLLALRKASFNLFKLECQELGLMEFVIFNNSADCQNYLTEIKNHTEREELKAKRDIANDKLDEYVKLITNRENYVYSFDKDVYKSANKDYLEKGVLNEQYVGMKFRKDVLQAEFEKALTGAFKHLNERENSQFSDVPDVRKIFVNLEVKNCKTLMPLKFYLEDMKNKIMDLKIMLYEMKCNGMARIEIPIRANLPFVKLMKEIYDLHFKIDRLFGNFLSYDQYLFFYECINAIINSNIKEEISILKSKEFMEEAIPKYILLSAMRQAVRIEERMRIDCKERNELFSRDNFFQILKFKLDMPESDYIYSFDVKRHMFYGNAFAADLDENKKLIEEEIIRYEERYWILEGIFNKEDKDLWISGIELLRNINNLVQDDIRDYILVNYKESGIKKDNKRATSSKKNVTMTSSNSIKQIKRKESLNSKDLKTKKKKQYARQTSQDKSFESDDEIMLNKKANLKYDLIRPPYVWNFPADKFKIKFQKELKEREKHKEKEDELITTEIRKVDPREFYKDGRVKEMLSIIERLTDKMLSNSANNKFNIFKFILECTLNVFGHHYYSKKEE